MSCSLVVVGVSCSLVVVGMSCFMQFRQGWFDVVVGMFHVALVGYVWT